MTVQASPWYLARDGKQFGPLTEAELAKFIELGHLQPNDLLWRDGFPDWRPAMVVFPPKRATGAVRIPSFPASSNAAPANGALRADFQPGASRLEAPGRRTASAPRRHGDDSDDEDDGARARPRRRGLRRAILAVLVLSALGGAGWFAYPHRHKLTGLAVSLPTFSLPTFGSRSPLEVADRASLDVPPLKGFEGNAETIDAALQRTALWRVLKRDFAEWYAERLKEIVALTGQGRNEAAIAQQMARALVALRRQEVNNALSASIPRLKLVAMTFYENLVQLKQQGSEACFEFISQGESSPIVIAMLQGSPHTAHLQAQLTTVFEAIAEGRKTPRVYPQPRKEDYDLLAADLGKRGWTEADLQLFSDERALARAAPEKVCQLVHDWFAAQLALKDENMQLRLLVDSLKPVVAG